ncbi:MAG: DUF4920 domain-containing protein [Planctomycetota bacterium]|jgi:hypothetical protein|nr:DUF4920 domain-containing protein [Planctomycetota bacterium]|tara:strand:- start:279 stop:722 length:444 start_codon:yes stop_codon:yes gene_type:complete
MKQFTFSAAALLSLLFAGCSTSPKLEVGVKEAGYEKVSLKNLISGVDKYQDKKVMIEGSILRVCQGRGCWVEVSDGTTKMIAKSIAHDVLLPKDCAGNEIQVMGHLRIDPETTCGEDHAHEKSEEEHGDHECPKPSILLEMEGAKLF